MMVKSLKSLPEWQKDSEKEISRILRIAEKTGPYPRGVPRAGRSVDVVVVGSTKMRSMNFKFRRKNWPTDVLSFPAPEEFRRKGHLGELVICAPVARAQAREQGHSEKAELRVLLIHGFLHLLGEDHEMGERAARRMARYERRILEALKQTGKRGLIERSR